MKLLKSAFLSCSIAFLIAFPAHAQPKPARSPLELNSPFVQYTASAVLDPDYLALPKEGEELELELALDFTEENVEDAASCPAIPEVDTVTSELEVVEYGGSTYAAYASFFNNEEPEVKEEEKPRIPTVPADPKPEPGIITPINKCLPATVPGPNRCEEYNADKHADIPATITRICNSMKPKGKDAYPVVACPAKNGTCLRCSDGKAAEEKDCTFDSQTPTECVGYRKVVPTNNPRVTRKFICSRLMTTCSYTCPDAAGGGF